MREKLFKKVRSHQNCVIGGFGFFLVAEIHKTEMSTHVQDSKEEKLCLYYLDLIPKGIRLQSI